MFDKKAFDVQFDNAIETLTVSEKTTKQILRELSRSVLDVLFFTEDIGYINRTINSLSPVNRRAAVEFFKEFSGFHFVKEADAFGKKDKKQFEEKKSNALIFLADPHNNIWTWAKVHLEMEVKAFDINAVAKYFSNALKRAEKAGYTDADVLAQVFASGIDIDAITLAMKQLSVKETQVMTMDAEVIVSEDESALY
jgi:hypothetical protein